MLLKKTLLFMALLLSVAPVNALKKYPANLRAFILKNGSRGLSMREFKINRDPAILPALIPAPLIDNRVVTDSDQNRAIIPTQNPVYGNHHRTQEEYYDLYRKFLDFDPVFTCHARYFGSGNANNYYERGYTNE